MNTCDTTMQCHAYFQLYHEQNIVALILPLKAILYNSVQSRSVLTFCGECHGLLMKYSSPPFGGHPQGKRTIRPEEEMVNTRKQCFCFLLCYPFATFFKKTIKEDRQNWESNRRLIGARKMSTNFTDHPRGMCSPRWKRCRNICAVY